ncbi:hypothetical protein AVEN_78262-1 [Araneus ventricosus]|uniref:Uncharacterized protein n=1 Tax=Araneus ventricosus TaxID=182803 RepID=A0A4Y2M9H6_ARAVE|nr:hypothetical protein AVEN_78262-1 [Araneus ventricosus]
MYASATNYWNLEFFLIFLQTKHKSQPFFQDLQGHTVSPYFRAKADFYLRCHLTQVQSLPPRAKRYFYLRCYHFEQELRETSTSGALNNIGITLITIP